MTLIDTYPSLHQTVRVDRDGTVTHGMDVPHEAANIPCGAFTGTRVDPDNGTRYDVHCRKRVGHTQPKDEAAHVPTDFRIIAAPRMVVHQQRFAPSNIPAGVDQNEVTIPHDCENHLPDTEQVLRRGW